MATESPFTITVYSKEFLPLGLVRNPVSCEFDPVFNGMGVGSITISPDDPVRAFLDTDGARVTVEYRGEHLMSGRVSDDELGFTSQDNTTYSIIDDWSVLRETLGWVAPMPGTYTSGELTPDSLTDDAQSISTTTHTAGTAEGGGHYPFTGFNTAEGLIKNLIEVNADRLGLPLTVAPNLSRGGDARAAGMLPLVRFEPLEDNILPLLAWSGLGLKVWHDGGAGLTVDVWEPTVWPQILTTASGIITSGKGTRDRLPAATRVVVGGPGEDNARAFWGVTDTTGLEVQYGSVVEVFRDATGANLNWPDTLSDAYRVAKYYLLRPEVASADKTFFQNYLDAAGEKGLLEGRPKASLSLTLSETELFHFGGEDGIHLGDQVTAETRGVTFEDHISSCELRYDAATGLTVTPQVGNRSEDPSMQLAQAIANVAAAQRRLSTKK